MITNFKQRTKKDDIKLLAWIIGAFLMLVWFCTPPGNKVLQICFWGNNTQMLISKLKHEDTTEYIFHRNNAVYLAKMYPDDNKRAIKEMDKAIALLPAFATEAQLQELYKERAQIHLFLGNYQKALSDYMNAGELGFNDYLKVAMLYRVSGNYRMALSYCNAILNVDASAFAGYACLADVYDKAGRTDTAIRVWDLAIDRKNNNPKAYMHRALLKKKTGDADGYNADKAIAKQYSPNINEKESIINDTLHPKILTLTAK